MAQSYIVLFDGVCNFCNGAVNFIIDHDPAARFRFLALQLEQGRKLLEPFDIHTDKLDSIVLLKEGKAFTHSGAVLEIVRYLSGWWPLLYVIKLVPAFLRDTLYNYIARRRYRWFGKMDTCRIPTAELRARFLA